MPKVRLGAKAQVSQETPLALAGGVLFMSEAGATN